MVARRTPVFVCEHLYSMALSILKQKMYYLNLLSMHLPLSWKARQGNLTTSHSVSEEGRVVSLVLLRNHVFTCILVQWLVLAIAALVLALEVEMHGNAQEATHCLRTEEDRVTRDVVRCIGGTVDEAGDGSSEVSLRKEIRVSHVTAGLFI